MRASPQTTPVHALVSHRCFSHLVVRRRFSAAAKTMGKDGKKSKKKDRESKVEEMGEPQGTLLDDAADALEHEQQRNKGADEPRDQQRDGLQGDSGGGAESSKSRDKAEKKEKKKEAKKRKELALSEGEASEQSKKQKNGNALAVAGGGEEENAPVVVKSRRGNDENWDKKMVGQKFGEWRCARAKSRCLSVLCSLRSVRRAAPRRPLNVYPSKMPPIIHPFLFSPRGRAL